MKTKLRIIWKILISISVFKVNLSGTYKILILSSWLNVVGHQVITIVCVAVWAINIGHFNDPAHGGSWLKVSKSSNGGSWLKVSKSSIDDQAVTWLNKGRSRSMIKLMALD